MEVMLKPKALRAKDKARARVAKNCLLVTLVSLNVGYGSLVESYQNEERFVPPELNSVTLTDEEVLTYRTELDQRRDRISNIPASMPPPTTLARHLAEVSASHSEVAVVKDANLKMYHVMSVKQTLREDLAEHSYQFSCRAADWSRSAFCSVPMQPAKAITEDVSVMRGPNALEWIQAVREEVESFKQLRVCEEVPRQNATSTPLPARLILVTKPNVHGSFQDS